MKKTLLLLVTGVLTLPLRADDAPKFSVDGIRGFWSLVPSGGDASLAWGAWKVSAGAGLEDARFGRDAGTGDELSASAPYTRPLVPDASVAVRYTWPLDFADAWVGAQAVGYGKPLGYGSFGVGSSQTTVFPDRDGNVYGALRTGLRRDRRARNAHGLQSGSLIDLRADWSPSAASLTQTDYYRFGLKSSLFFPLWDWDGAAQVFSGLLALRGNVSWTDGNHVPIPRLEPTEVRGYRNTYDAKLLTVVTAELRVRLSSWSNAHDVVPVGFGFVDAGNYLGFASSATMMNRAGGLLSAGMGAGLELWDIITPSLTFAVPLAGVAPRLWYTLALDLEF